jgi:hypothetical protein
LDHYGFGETMIGNIRQLYEGATSVAQVNGFHSQRVNMEHSIRQYFPLSTLLYSLCLDPLLRTINNSIQACKSAKYRYKMVTAAYVDDVTFLLRSTQEVQIVQEAVHLYAEESGAEINYTKSRAMAVFGWSEDIPVMGVTYHSELLILGVVFKPTIQATADTSWKAVTNGIRNQARDMYHRDLALHQRVMQIYICWQRHGT